MGGGNVMSDLESAILANDLPQLRQVLTSIQDRGIRCQLTTNSKRPYMLIDEQWKATNKEEAKAELLAAIVRLFPEKIQAIPTDTTPEIQSVLTYYWRSLDGVNRSEIVCTDWES